VKLLDSLRHLDRYRSRLRHSFIELLVSPMLTLAALHGINGREAGAAVLWLKQHIDGGTNAVARVFIPL
jgi:hypothetical protein